MFREDGTVAFAGVAARVERILNLCCCKESLYDPKYQNMNGSGLEI